MSKAKKAVTVVASTTIVQAPGSRGLPPGSLVSIEDPAEAERLVASGRATWPPETPKAKPVAKESDRTGPDDGALV